MSLRNKNCFGRFSHICADLDEVTFLHEKALFQVFEVKHILMVDLFLINKQLLSSQDGN